MRTIIRHVECTGKTGEVHLFPSPDIHAGNVECQEKLLDDWIARIKADKSAYWFGMGDYCEFINRKDKRFEEEALAQWLWGKGDIAKTQREWAIAKLKPIAGKCLAMVQGNHEATIQQYNERDVYGPLCEAMGATEAQPLALESLGFVRLIFGRPRSAEKWTLDCFLTHGWWAGRLQGNGALNLERLAGWVDAQVILAGHDHKLKTLAQTIVRPCKNGEVEEVRQVCGSCGAFLNGARYSERAGYRPSPTGYLVLTVRPFEHEVRITM